MTKHVIDASQLGHVIGGARAAGGRRLKQLLSIAEELGQKLPPAWNDSEWHAADLAEKMFKRLRAS